jgi:hypothetical protein
VRQFAFFALEDQRTSCMTCGTGPPCHRMDTPVCIGGDFSRCFEAGARESVFKEGFIPRVAAMPCFFPTRGVLSPPSSLHPFAFKVSALRCRSLPWPCKFISSVPRLSECSTWYTACLDGMRRRSTEGFASVPSTLVNLPLESSCLLSSPAGWCCRSCLSSAGGARPCGSGALPPVLGFKDVHQHRGGGERAESWLRLPHELVTRLFLQHSEEMDDHQPCEGGELRVHGPDQTASTACRRAPSSMAWMVLSSPPVEGRGRGPLRHGAHAEVVATAGEATRHRGGCHRWQAVGAEVVAAACESLGAEVAAAAGEPWVQRWSPPLASRLS